jgi:hypothetical protein
MAQYLCKHFLKICFYCWKWNSVQFENYINTMSIGHKCTIRKEIVKCSRFGSILALFLCRLYWMCPSRDYKYYLDQEISPSSLMSLKYLQSEYTTKPNNMTNSKAIRTTMFHAFWFLDEWGTHYSFHISIKSKNELDNNKQAKHYYSCKWLNYFSPIALTEHALNVWFYVHCSPWFSSNGTVIFYKRK